VKFPPWRDTMKVKFLRDYHGPETNEVRFNQDSIGNFSPEIAENLIGRKIAFSIEKEPEVFEEVVEPAIKIVEPKVIVKRGRKTK
jgi:hypothetical protein